MLRILSLLLCAVISMGALTSCKKKTAADRKIEKIAKLRDDKRKNAVKYYRQLAKDYPEHPHAQEALEHASKLEAAGKK